jgi:NitT/TauT family transport system ATP-binding protein
MIATLKNKNLLHLHNVHKVYPDKKAKNGQNVVLNDIDLSVEKGEFCTVVGPSGCGKTTLLRMILGQERSTSGEILLGQKTIGTPCDRRGIVYQNYSLFPHKTVLENVMSHYKFNNGFIKRLMNPAEYRNAKDEAMHFLQKVRLIGAENKYPEELSGGMKQRASIAQSLIAKPEILLMDEPFSALDPGTREDLQLFTKEIWEENKMTIFFVSHDLEESLFLGTRLLVVSQFYKGEGEEASKLTPKEQGSLIVSDYDIKSFEDKTTKEFGEMIQTIRLEGLDEEHRQHIQDFNLKHADSFSDGR